MWKSAREVGKLDPHQTEAIDACVAHLGKRKDDGKSRRAVLVLPTGTGKTAIALVLPYVLKSNRVLILTPRDTLKEQMGSAAKDNVVKNAKSFFKNCGIVEEGDEYVFGTITVADKAEDLFNGLHGVSTLISNAQMFQDRDNQQRKEWRQLIPPDMFDLVVVDEAHFHPADTWKNVCDHFHENASCNIVFLTATPYRADDESVCEPDEICAQLKRTTAVALDIIRDVDEIPIKFDDAEEMEKGHEDFLKLKSLMKRVKLTLGEHDDEFPLPEGRKHKALVMVGGITGLNPSAVAHKLEDDCKKDSDLSALCARAYCTGSPGENEKGSSKSELDWIMQLYKNYDELKRKQEAASVAPPPNKKKKTAKKTATAERPAPLPDEPRVLIVNNMLREGFDFAAVSVVAIGKSFDAEDTPVFEQFIGRAVRRFRPIRAPNGSLKSQEPVSKVDGKKLTAKLIHHSYDQLGGLFKTFKDDKTYSDTAKLLCEPVPPSSSSSMDE